MSPIFCFVESSGDFQDGGDTIFNTREYLLSLQHTGDRAPTDTRDSNWTESTSVNAQSQEARIGIPKGDEAKDLIKNWRPISLLNVVCKIGSACIANRLKTVVHSLIDEDQTGFIANRFIGENIRLIYDQLP